MFNIKAALLFNGFIFIDNHLKKMLSDALSLLTENIDNSVDLTLTYFQ